MTETMVTPLESVAQQGAEARSRFPGDSDDDKERRALKAALQVAELKGEFSSVTAVRLHLERLFNVSERQIRRAEKILRYPEITNASHVIEHASVDTLRIAWACAPEDARQEFCEQPDRAGQRRGA
jgi:hypothetical protein